MIKKLLIILVSVVFLFSGFIVSDGLIDELGEADVILIFGNKVNEDGSLSKRLEGRLEKAYSLYEQGYGDLIFVSGGIGKEGYDEALVMKETLVEWGVDGEDVIVDSEGNNSWLTCIHLSEFMNEESLESVLLVSSFTHIKRAELCLQKQGIVGLYSASSDYFELRDLYSLARELPAYVKYLFL